MDWKKTTGKLLLVAAGTGALVLIMFVLVPILTMPEEPPGPPAPEEIVAEVLGSMVAEPAGNELDEGLTDEAGEGVAVPQDTAEDAVMPVPSPLVAVRNDGEELPVVFPRGEPGADAADAEDNVLPPPLTPEEIEAALPDPPLVTEADQAADDSPLTETAEDFAEEASRQVAVGGEESVQGQWDAAVGQLPAVTVLDRPTGASPEDVREVQALLKELGYDPGPVDGVWGERTTAAWRAFAREAGGLALALVMASVEDPSEVRRPPVLEEFLGPEHPESRAPVEAASPSEEPSLEEASGAVQAGNPSPGPPAGGMVMEGTLRGVMGYRMPLVSRQEVPDQVVSGVLIPAHTTFVILRPGYWELTGLSPDDVAYLRDAAARSEAEARTVKPEPQSAPVRRGWNPLRIFRRQAPGGE